MPERCRVAITISAQGTRRPRTSDTQTQDKAINHESSTTPFCPRDHNGIRDGQLHFELLAPKATAMAAEDLGDLQAEILEVKHAIRSHTPCTLHGCEDAGYTAQQLKSARSLPHANRGHETHSSITTTETHQGNALLPTRPQRHPRRPASLPAASSQGAL